MNKKNYYENKCNSVQVLVKLAENAKKTRFIQSL